MGCIYSIPYQLLVYNFQQLWKVKLTLVMKFPVIVSIISCFNNCYHTSAVVGAVEAADWSVVAIEIDEGAYTKASPNTFSTIIANVYQMVLDCSAADGI